MTLECPCLTIRYYAGRACQPKICMIKLQPVRRGTPAAFSSRPSTVKFARNAPLPPPLPAPSEEPTLPFSHLQPGSHRLSAHGHTSTRCAPAIFPPPQPVPPTTDPTALPGKQRSRPDSPTAGPRIRPPPQIAARLPATHPHLHVRARESTPRGTTCLTLADTEYPWRYGQRQ